MGVDLDFATLSLVWRSVGLVDILYVVDLTCLEWCLGSIITSQITVKPCCLKECLYE